MMFCMLFLKEMNLDDAKIEWEFFQSCPGENGVDNEFFGMSFDDFCNKGFSVYLLNLSGENLINGFVPETYYFLYDDEIGLDKIIGLFRVRHFLNDSLYWGSGHIGYIIHPEFRKKCYGTLGLKLAIDKLKNMEDFSEDEVFLRCLKTNEASFKVMLKNGGYLHHQDDNYKYVRVKV